MNTHLECLPCFFNQALRSAKLATNDQNLIRKVLNQVGMMIKDIPLDCPPPETGALIDRTIKQLTGNSDIFAEIKKKITQQALSLYPALKKRTRQSSNPLQTAIRLAIAGNVIDFGVNQQFDLEKDIEDILNTTPKINDWQTFIRFWQESEEILYLGDNAGETVFDRILIEELNKKTTFVVREVAVINDATREDARQAGIDRVAKIISSGSKMPGTKLSSCHATFFTMFNQATFIISKGQGNYECLSEEHGPIFFLLKAKCPVIARDLGVNVGDIILKGPQNSIQ